ncbi:condensation domain-containing protein, partial [Pandoraea pneumonica]
PAQTIAGAVAQTAAGEASEIPLLPIQSWFFSEPIPQRDHWNQWVQVDVRDAGRPLDDGILREALQAVAAHHEALQMRYVQSGDGWQQQ